MTLVSVSQYDEQIEAVWDPHLFRGVEGSGDFGDYYYSVANSSDKVTVGVRVEGLEEGKSYKVFDDQTVTAADNGSVVYGEVAPSVSMGSYTCYENEWGGEDCSGDIHGNEYVARVILRDDEWNWYDSVTAVLRPAVVGSSDIEILSVKQDGVEVYLDTVGRQENNLNIPQTINEYQLLSYDKPVTIEYRVKNLHVGWRYTFSVGNGETMSAVADTDEGTGSVDVDVSALDKHTSIGITFYGYETGAWGNGEHESSVTLYFNIVDEDFVSLGNLVVDEIRQGGDVLEAVEGENWREYMFGANDVEDLKVTVRATTATNDLNYYVGYSLNSASSYSYGALGWVAVSGAELKEGVVLTVPARYGESEDSPFALDLYVRTIEGTRSYSNRSYCYEQCEDDWGGDTIKVNFEVDPSLPRYGVDYTYAVYQGENEIMPNDEGVYVISDYTQTISLRTTINEEEGETPFCESMQYVSLDEEGNALGSGHAGRYNTSCMQITEDSGRYGMNIFLDVSTKTTRVDLGIYDTVLNDYGSYSSNKKLEEFSLQFTYADYDSAHIPSLEVTELRQGGRVVEPESGYDYVTFRLNSVENYEYDVRGYDLLDGVEYTMYVDGEQVVYRKSDLENGVTIMMPAGDGQSLLGSSNYAVVFGYYGSRPTYDGVLTQIWVDSALNQDLPVFDTCVKYQNNEGCLSSAYPSLGVLPYVYGTIEDVEGYDAENNPLILLIKGERYESEVEYEVSVRVRYMGEVLMEDDFRAMGAEIVNGIEKEYFDEIRFATMEQLFDGSFVEGGYNVDVTIGEVTKRVDFMANGGANATSVLLSSDGLSFYDYFSDDGGGMGAIGGNVFVGYGESYIAQALFGDHAYLYTGALRGDIEGVNYHIYQNVMGENQNDLSGATLVREGTVSANEEIGLNRVDKVEGTNDFYYTVVLEKNGRILAIQHSRVYLEDVLAGVGMVMSLKTDDESALDGYYLSKEIPVKVVVYGARFDEAATYTANVTVRVNGGKMYENSEGVAGAELNQVTELFTIPYENLFRQDVSSCEIGLILKNTDGDVLMRRSVYLTKGNGENWSVYDSELMYMMIRALEQGGEEPGDEVILDDRTPGDVEVHVEDGVLVMVSNKPALVIGIKDGEYELVEVESEVVDGEMRTNSYEVEEFDEVKVALKGDGDMDGEVSTADSNLINRSLISPSLRPYRALSAIERLVFDLDGDGDITTADSNLINRSLISSSLRPYRAIEW